MVARSSIFCAAAAVVVAVALWSGASWGVDTLASSGTKAAGANGDTGAVGTGSTGATGSQGVAGGTGPAEHIATTGPSGLSALTYSAMSATGLALYTGSTYNFSTQTGAVPAGPTLVGFSVRLSLYKFPLSLTCSLVEEGNPATILATTASLLVPVLPKRTTFAAAQVVSLAEATPLTVECRIVGISGDFPLYYEALSIYAISFATS